jgi:hypothetical protein
MDWEEKDDKKKKDAREELLNWKDWEKFNGMTDEEITAYRQKNEEIVNARAAAEEQAKKQATKLGSGGGKKKTKKHKKTLKKKKSKRGSIRKRK